ncbi:hypothetical protein NKR19_g575 [Coniochaeta hoffmannii]|uniref:Uncharacterized protein n=1 Tax=Coniochaeta hoffmannii TaxID=91930 RepID=A0AA38VPW4_9PEZI|nr:hypothetical protein NKR19_g575 [Coniochaeta hoffmannii]
MADSQGAIPTATSGAQYHPAVTQSRAPNTQSAPAAAAPAHAARVDPDPSEPGPSSATAGPKPPAAEQQQQHPSQPQPQPLPPLPAPDSASSSGGPTVEVNGARVSLADQLGPAVVNADGTMSRIANWGEMTEVERRNTVRILGARNKLRLEALREGQDRKE